MVVRCPRSEPIQQDSARGNLSACPQVRDISGPKLVGQSNRGDRVPCVKLASGTCGLTDGSSAAEHRIPQDHPLRRILRS